MAAVTARSALMNNSLLFAIKEDSGEPCVTRQRHNTQPDSVVVLHHPVDSSYNVMYQEGVRVGGKEEGGKEEGGRKERGRKEEKESSRVIDITTSTASKDENLTWCIQAN